MQVHELQPPTSRMKLFRLVLSRCLVEVCWDATYMERRVRTGVELVMICDHPYT